jgi:site-specific recombinase XerD
VTYVTKTPREATLGVWYALAREVPVVTSRANPIPGTVETVKGYPSVLKIFRCLESRFIQVQAYMDGYTVRRSTKTESKAEAKEFAKKLWNELLLKQSRNQPLTKNGNFEKVALDLIQYDQTRVDQGDRKQSMVADIEYILKSDLSEFFKRDHVKAIDFARIREYKEHLQKRKLSSSTIRNHFIVLRKVLKHARRMGIMHHEPEFPAMEVKDNPREWFSEEEYPHLLKTIDSAIKEGIKVRYVPITQELRDCVEFAVSTFTRPHDLKALQHKHVEVKKRPNGFTYLRLMCYSKKEASPVVSMERAVAIYERIKGKAKPDDYLFFNAYKRSHAMSIMAKQFKYILEKAGLYQSDSGAQRGLYSLRHTAAMMEILHGKLRHETLAANMRTSPEMLHRFYIKHLEGEMLVEQFYQRPDPVDTIQDFLEKTGQK